MSQRLRLWIAASIATGCCLGRAALRAGRLVTRSWVRWSQAAGLGLVLITAGCGQPSPASPQWPVAAEDPSSSRVLVVAISREPASVAAKTLRRTGAGIGPDTSRPFNAGLALRDAGDSPNPYLAEALPELNTDTWRVYADGRMETTFRLRAGLKWHDAASLTADDFVFAWRVYSTPDFGYSESPPVAQMEEVLAPDPRSVVIRWKQPFPGAPRMDAEDFPPLPRHALEEAYRTGDSDSFIAHPYWGDSHVGLGPYRLERWELGSFIEGSGFDGHALGLPRSHRLKLLFVTDPNAAVATLLSGAAHTADNRIIRLRQGLVLKERWGDGVGGRVLFIPQEVRWTLAQFKPEFVNPAALLDVRVRRALAHAIDKQGLVDGLLEGQGLPADTLVVPQVAYFASLDRALAKYAYDPRSSQQLMEQVGHTRGQDGFFVGRAGERFALALSISGLAQNESEATIMADSFRRAGFDTSIQVLSQAEASDRQVRSSFPGLSSTSNTNGFEPPVNFLRASQIPTPENRWRGSNRGGWHHSEFERLVAAFETTLEDRERQQRVVELLKLVSDELPGFALYYNLAVFVHIAGLTGPAGGINWNWNIHEWELRGSTRAGN